MDIYIENSHLYSTIILMMNY
uniref:Uncharacterized protein n=1 Tax=Heterorhabditis bacteriophora TaxID=37862 RepID=A0A1I7X2F9_HETBA